eukprot:scaffold95370_cov61-Phaeocystis_antarctica.AAC.1
MCRWRQRRRYDPRHLHQGERGEMARRDDDTERHQQEGAKEQPLHYLLQLALALAVRSALGGWRAGRAVLVESVVARIGV